MERPTLREIQEEFRKAILQESSPLSRPSPRLESWLERREGIEVYWDAYFVRFAECFEEDFPCVNEQVTRHFGEGVFRGLVMEYLRAHPPSDPSLNAAGRDFPEYVARDVLGERVPELADLARLERLVVESFLSPRSPVEEPRWDKLDGTCRLIPAPSLRRLRPRHPVLHHRDGSGAVSGERLVIWRGEEGGAVVERIDDVTLRLLEGAESGASLESLCAEFSDEEAESVQRALATAVKRRWVVGYSRLT